MSAVRLRNVFYLSLYVSLCRQHPTHLLALLVSV